MKIIKNIIITILLLIITICAFGGGCIIWIFLALFIQPSPQTMEIMFYITALIPIPFCWHIAPKLSNKLL